MKDALAFLGSQKLMALACYDAGTVWIANVFVGIDEKGLIYFVSPKDTKHSLMIIKNESVAFSFAWFDPQNAKNRKAIQGQGKCRPAQNETEIATGVMLHNQNFPEFKTYITLDWIHANSAEACIWIIKPTYMKYWDDELYAEKESKEFTFS